jgi:hypothetical protein
MMMKRQGRRRTRGAASRLGLGLGRVPPAVCDDENCPRGRVILDTAWMFGFGKGGTRAQQGSATTKNHSKGMGGRLTLKLLFTYM